MTYGAIPFVPSFPGLEYATPAREQILAAFGGSSLQSYSSVAIPAGMKEPPQDTGEAYVKAAYWLATAARLEGLPWMPVLAAKAFSRYTYGGAVIAVPGRTTDPSSIADVYRAAAEELNGYLDNAGVVIVHSMLIQLGDPAAIGKAQEEERSKRWGWLIPVGVGVLAIGGGAWWWRRRQKSGRKRR